MKPTIRVLVLIAAMFGGLAQRPAPPADVSFRIRAHMDPPRWATLERQLLAENVPACREFFKKYFDDRGYLQCFVRWGANDGPDDAFENFNRWPELHALGARDEILQMFSKGHEGLIAQYTEARTTDVPIARQGMYYKEFIVQSDWMHHGEGLQLFNRMGLSIPTDAEVPGARAAVRRVLHGRGSRSAQLRPAHKIIRSMENGSRGPMLRKATAARLGRRSVRRRRTSIAAARRVDIRAVPRALPGIQRRRRRSLPESGRHDAADRTPICLPASRSTRSGSSSTWTPGSIG